MYYFVFYFIYKSQVKDGSIVARYFATLIVALALLLQLGLVYSFTRFIFCYLWGISIARADGQPTFENKQFYLLIMLSIALISFKVFDKKRIESILTRYQENENFFSFLNIVKFLLIFLLPLLVAIFFENKSVLYCGTVSN